MLVLVLLVAGCGGTTAGPETARPAAVSGASMYAAAPCPNPIYPGAAAFDLGAGVECGYLTVPENRARPNGRTIRLAVARARATSPNPAPDPLVYLAGGPGGSGLISAASRIEAGWNRDRDVIFLDQRGTWKSDPLLSCPEIDTFMAEWVGLSSFDAATTQRSGAAARACRDRLAASGVDLSAYNTTENAADVAELRTALGVAEWNLYGVSYGTDLALQTLRDHPEGIRSVVLDSVVPPQTNLLLSFWPSAASGITALVDACTAQPACRSTYPTLRADIVRLANELGAAPRTVVVPDPASGTPARVVVDGYKLINHVVTASLEPGGVGAVPRAVDNLARGDGTVIATALLAASPPPGVTSYGLALGVFCGEAAPGAGTAAVVATGRRVLPELPDAVLALTPQTPYIFGDCREWNVPAAPPSVAAPTVSDRPVLVLDGALDAITAPANGELAARSLSRATRVRFPDAGHDVVLWSTACALPIMQSFLDDPATVDLGCAGPLAPAPFAPR